MKKLLPLILIFGGVGLAIITWTGYQKAERAESENDALRDLIIAQSAVIENEPVSVPEPAPVYDPSDLDQTPPGITPFIGTTVCMVHWGNHLKQYCAGGDQAALELIDGGDDQAETMRTLTMCLNELLHRTDAYSDVGMRPMDSAIPLDEVNRKAFACSFTEKYGGSYVYDEASIYYLVKEHMESGNISRLEKR